MRSTMIFLLLVTGCEKDLLADMHDAGPDGAPAVDAPGRCSSPMTDAHAGAKYTLFVNFDGVTLTKCSDPSSSQNCSDLVQTTTVFPPFMDGNPARDSFISSILYSAWKGLAPYSIDIVTTRPPAGDYYMMVFGGTPDLIGAPATVGGVSPHNCFATNRNLISLNFDRGQAPTSIDYANSILSDLAMMAGVPVTSGPLNDCACRSCAFDPGKICTYGVDSPTVTNDPVHACGVTTVDEPALLQGVLGCR